MNNQEELVNEPEKMCKIFQVHFPLLFEMGSGTKCRSDLMDLLTGLPRFSGREAKYCEGMITAVEVQENFVRLQWEQVCDTFSYVIYNSMLDLVCVLTN